MILFSLLKSHTIISSPLSLFSFHKRFMLSTSKHLVKKTLTLAEKEQIAKSTLQFCSFVNNSHVVKDLSANKIQDSYNQINDYLSSDLGTIQIKTTLLFSLGNITLSLNIFA